MASLSIRLQVVRAHNLIKADRFGKSDPYCRLRWGSDDLGVTEHQKSTLSPLWELEYFDLSLAPEDTDRTLAVSVFDYDKIGSDDFLGGVRVTGAELVAMCTTAAGEEKVRIVVEIGGERRRAVERTQRGEEAKRQRGKEAERQRGREAERQRGRDSKYSPQ